MSSVVITYKNSNTTHKSSITLIIDILFMGIVMTTDSIKSRNKSRTITNDKG